jgi:hypothetical protein
MRRRERLGLFIFDRMRKLDVVSLQPGTQPSGCISCYLHGHEFLAATSIKLSGIRESVTPLNRFLERVRNPAQCDEFPLGDSAT